MSYDDLILRLLALAMKRRQDADTIPLGLRSRAPRRDHRAPAASPTENPFRPEEVACAIELLGAVLDPPEGNTYEARIGVDEADRRGLLRLFRPDAHDRRHLRPVLAGDLGASRGRGHGQQLLTALESELRERRGAQPAGRDLQPGRAGRCAAILRAGRLQRRRADRRLLPARRRPRHARQTPLLSRGRIPARSRPPRYARMHAGIKLLSFTIALLIAAPSACKRSSAPTGEAEAPDPGAGSRHRSGLHPGPPAAPRGEDRHRGPRAAGAKVPAGLRAVHGIGQRRRRGGRPAGADRDGPRGRRGRRQGRRPGGAAPAHRHPTQRGGGGALERGRPGRRRDPIRDRRQPRPQRAVQQAGAAERG